MHLYQIQFIEFVLNRKVFKFGEFTLKSGRVSPYFYDIGLLNTGHDLTLLGQFYAAALINSGIDFDLLFGPAYKGIPIVISTAIALVKHYKRNVPYCFNRKEVKNHGEGGNIIGNILQGKVVLVDDVITAGTTIRESMEIIKFNSAIPAGVLISLDRQECWNNISATQVVKNNYNCEVISIITLEDLIFYLEKNSGMSDRLVAIRAYREKFGI